MIQIKDLQFGYSPVKKLFKGLSAELHSGNIYGLLGKNGAGKTTFLRLISGLLFPHKGEIGIDGLHPGDRFPGLMREIYLVNEEFYLPSIEPDLFVRLYSPFYPRFSHSLLLQFMQELKLPLEQKLSNMSYGQKKGFLLSFGLATDCRLLLLDEPTNGLDIPSKSQFRKMVANAIHEDRTFIISTHQVRDMENLIDPVLIMDEGELIFNRSMEEISSRLSFRRISAEPDPEALVYSESSLGIHQVIEMNLGEHETSINLEILFNAVISKKEKFESLFNEVIL